MLEVVAALCGAIKNLCFVKGRQIKQEGCFESSLAANTITAAYGGNKSPETPSDDTSLDTLTKALTEMKELGFDSLEDYLAYKQKQ